MKKSIFLIAIAFFSFNDHHTSFQDDVQLKITYSHTVDSTAYLKEPVGSAKYQRVLKLMNRTSARLKDTRTTLIMNNKKEFSLIFQDNNNPSYGPTYRSAAITADSFNVAFGNKSTIFYENINEDFSVKIDYNDLFEYEITNETKDILGFKCYKAIPKLKSNDYKAVIVMPEYVYFTNQLPYLGGPTLAVNLPGPILEVKNKLTIIKALKIEKTNSNLEKKKSLSRHIISCS